MMNTKRYFSGLCGAWVIMLIPGAVSGAGTVVTPALIGHWQGNARIIVNWCSQTNLSLALEIRADGRVTGKVGDATLTQGRLDSNRGWLGRKLHLKTDYIITGELNGPLVAAERIRRARVKVPVNFTGTSFVGGVHTSGSKFGGKERMIFSASSLTLTRPNAP